MSRIMALGLNTFREAIRNKVLYSLLFFAVLMILSSLGMAQLSFNEGPRVTRDIGLGGIALFGVLIAIFVGVNLVYKELDRKTVFMLIPKPIHRYEFILGKFSGMVLTLAVQVVVMALVLFLVLMFQGLGIEQPVLCAVSLTFAEVVVITAVAVFFSSFTTPFLSGAFTLGLFAVGRSMPELRELVGKIDSSGVRSTVWASLNLVPDLHIFYVSGGMIDGQHVSVHTAYVTWGYVLGAYAYGAAYAACALLFACILFSRRDFV